MNKIKKTKHDQINPPRGVGGKPRRGFLGGTSPFEKKAQQEMVGFVLIVVLVVVGLMVFLVISANNSPEDRQDNLEVGNMLDSILRQTTDCAIVFEPQYDSFEELFKSCHKNKKCNNLGKMACDYLNESLRGVLSEIIKSESTIQAYQFSLSEKEGEGILSISEGNCAESRSTASSQRNLVSGNQQLIVRMKICKEA